MKYIGIITGIFTGELFLKNYAEKKWKLHEEKPVLKGRIVIRRYKNSGAFLNMGQTKSLLMRALSVGLTAAVFVLFLCTLTQKGNGLLKTGLSILLGGAFSNTYDRLRRKYVVDYFSFHTGFPALDRIVFNISDFCILIGSLFIVMGA